MNADRELEQWQQQWQTNGDVPVGLRAKIDRQTRVMRLHVAGQAGVTAIYGGGSAIWALTSSRGDAVVLAIAIWLFIATAWSFSLSNRKGIWKPATSTTAAFLDLLIIRCHRRLQAITFSSVLYAVILSFNLAWIYHDQAGRHVVDLWMFLTSGSMLLVWLVTVGLGLLATAQRRKVRTQLSNLVTVHRQLDDPIGRREV